MKRGHMSKSKINKIALTSYGKTVSAEFSEDETLDEVLSTVEGLIRALGYCFDGKLEIVDEEV
jgi:hypothetical protein